MDLFTILVAVAFWAAFLYPVWLILRKMGYEAGKAGIFVLAVALLPGIGILGLLWLLAVENWPILGVEGD